MLYWAFILATHSIFHFTTYIYETGNNRDDLYTHPLSRQEDTFEMVIIEYTNGIKTHD